MKTVEEITGLEKPILEEYLADKEPMSIEELLNNCEVVEDD